MDARGLGGRRPRGRGQVRAVADVRPENQTDLQQHAHAHAHAPTTTCSSWSARVREASLATFARTAGGCCASYRGCAAQGKQADRARRRLGRPVPSTCSSRCRHGGLHLERRQGQPTLHSTHRAARRQRHAMDRRRLGPTAPRAAGGSRARTSTAPTSTRCSTRLWGLPCLSCPSRLIPSSMPPSIASMCSSSLLRRTRDGAQAVCVRAHRRRRERRRERSRIAGWRIQPAGRARRGAAG
mmetsp:Transcript_51582/g.172130  ORF Transcript_51582/g.172130 Transcript_51582/m.172130 type:complete len:240 (-) Transcript_51582:59-778(-)